MATPVRDRGRGRRRPWESMPKTGKGVTPQARGRMLADYAIHAKTLRFGDGKDAKGYERASFVEAWTAYLSDGDGLRTVEPLTCLETRHFRDSRTVDGNCGVNGSGDAENPEKRGMSTVQRFECTGERGVGANPPPRRCPCRCNRPARCPQARRTGQRRVASRPRRVHLRIGRRRPLESWYGAAVRPGSAAGRACCGW